MITIVLSGDYYKPHLVMRVGNDQTRMHSESYATRGSAQRAQRTLARKLGYVSRFGKVETADETVRP